MCARGVAKHRTMRCCADYYQQPRCCCWAICGATLVLVCWNVCERSVSVCRCDERLCDVRRCVFVCACGVGCGGRIIFICYADGHIISIVHQHLRLPNTPAIRHGERVIVIDILTGSTSCVYAIILTIASMRYLWRWC